MLQVLKMSLVLSLPMLSLPYRNSTSISFLGFTVTSNTKVHLGAVYRKDSFLRSRKDVCLLMRKTEFRQGFPHTWLTSPIAQKWIKESNITAVSFSFGTF